MPLVITPELGIPLPFDVTPEEVVTFRERAKAACQTILELIESGAKMPDMDDKTSEEAHKLFAAEKPISVAKTPPAVILKLEALLSTYDHEFLDAQRRITNFVTNRLMEETENEDAGKRLKALELLGKKVGMFSDRMEVTVKQKPAEEIEAELARLLERYVGEAIPVEATEVEDKPLSPLEIDLDAELGLKDDDEQPAESVRED
jgi:oligoendopeptidase F